MNNKLIILKSHKQAVIKGNSAKEKISNSEKIITIDNNLLSVELPDTTSLITTITPHGTENGKEIYHTNEGCPVTISDNELFMNLYETHDMAVTFFLNDSTQSKSWIKRLFGLK